MAALSSLSFLATPTRQWTASLNQDGFSAIQKIVQVSTPQISLGTAAANNAAGGADQLFSAIHEIAASGTLTLDLQNAVDCMLRTAQSLVRVKYLEFWLLSAADVLGNVTGNACSQVTIGNAGSNPFAMELGGTTHTKVLKNGEFACWGTRAAAGLTVSGTAKALLITNVDAVNVAKLLVTIVGGTT